MLHAIQSQACDICGFYMGITPYDNHSSIGMYYRNRAFNGYSSISTTPALFPDGHLRNAAGNYIDHHDASVPIYSSSDYEIYRTAELHAKYFLHERIELNAIIPYRYNSQSMNNAIEKTEGIGDANLFAGYHLIRKIEVEGIQQRLIVGGGVKLPTGNYREMNGDRRIDALIQPGTGSLDGFFNAIYYFGIKKFGANVSGTYKINGTNVLFEHISNSTTLSASLFYKIQAMHDKMMFIPKSNIYYEYSKGLFVYDTYQSGTAMNVLMVGPALDVYYKNVELNLSVDLPVYEKQETNALCNSGRVSIGIVFNFNQKNYLFKK